MGDVEIHSSPETKFPSGIPWTTATDYVDLLAYTADVGSGGGTVIEDPWSALRTTGQITIYAPDTSPIPDPTGWPGGYTADTDLSMLIQFDPTIQCPQIEYALWKEVAQFGGDNVHYMTWSTGDEFQENGSGTVDDAEDWIEGNPGLWFFDTTNGVAPDGTNLTPSISFSGGVYAAGFLYFNTTDLRTTGAGATTVDTIMVPPGEPFTDTFTGGPAFTGVYNAEPFIDANANGIWDPGETFTDTIPPGNGGTDGSYDAEPWVNIDYGTVAPYDMRVVDLPGTETQAVTVGAQTVTRTTTNARDDAGLPIVMNVNFVGVVFKEGVFEAQGNMIYYGSVIGKQRVGPGAGTPDLYFDERLIKGEWPPPELTLPLTMVTVWKTDY